MSPNQNRSQASQQYFEIRNELNRANKSKNLKTELEFVLRENEDEYFIIIRSTSAEYGLRLAYKNKIGGQWMLFEHERFRIFFKYMFMQIYKLNHDEPNLNNKLTGWLLRLWVI